MTPPLRELYFSTHATETMRRREVTVPEVEQVLRDYHIRYPSQHRGEFVYRSDSLAVVVAEYPGKQTVVTVLLPSQDQWTDEDVAQRPRT